ncbi:MULTISPECIES: pilus assembly protein PilP [Pseudoalteromonas]|uniref:Pilus assembly protein PilP n=1 Tax=Pseudoalteromonas fuliginea TaxID=1872678 RepID=A0AB73BIT7_9GAMM|nr:MULTISPECIES: pilus assembly protein PilP [Pseudoalteromonas]ALQ09405.1 pilus assembly protein PilP [Pseudoalteromonas sp. Bsw20308]ATG76392.1 pilus assembly protein PilP [Pseudoalteromonas sp. 1_2015MBL_MicDiv]KAA1162097.1 pilus assembly protein PilP [Pseudoalteromonas fuliginea]KDC52194.1 pilus assembly protein PilP [Pseudoalteromonas fuliginea]KDC55036.1 pilus assembly protein PilP [Pseudoalteromonas sp. S3431]
MKHFSFIPIVALLLSGCNDDTSEQKEFIDQVKASTTARVEAIPELTKFEHFEYNAGQLRSPFVAPQPEIIQNKLTQVKNCLHPDPERQRETLEKYPLDNLSMKGTIGSSGQAWALITATDDTLHRITVGNYLGSYDGKVQSVNNDYIELIELIPDGSGCWKERLTKLEMLEAATNGAG